MGWSLSTEPRSSTGTHYAEGFEHATAGVAENDFFGIALTNDLTAAPTVEIAGLAALLLALLAKPRFNRLDASAAFWIVAFGAAYVLRAVTLVPLLTNIVYTRTAYPYVIVIPHCIVASASYRKLKGDGTHYLESFCMAFVCYGFGGSIFSDLLMGLPITALANTQIVPCYVLGWALIWFSPADVTYRMFTDSNSFLRYFLIACEEVDGVTTVMGRVARSARELQNKVSAPIMAGLFAGTGGAVIRAAAFGGDKSSLISSFEAGFWKTLGYSILWWWLAVYRCENGMVDLDGNHCATYNGSDWLRVVIASWHVFWALSCAAGLVSTHPFIWISKKVRKAGTGISRTLQLGPKTVEKVKKKKL